MGTPGSHLTQPAAACPLSFPLPRVSHRHFLGADAATESLLLRENAHRAKRCSPIKTNDGTMTTGPGCPSATSSMMPGHHHQRSAHIHQLLVTGFAPQRNCTSSFGVVHNSWLPGIQITFANRADSKARTFQPGRSPQRRHRRRSANRPPSSAPCSPEVAGSPGKRHVGRLRREASEMGTLDIVYITVSSLRELD